ncbi:hypothetical protein [Croceiramulus getboli]|nr:hypothetical protein P8624_01110 [Flavobacteriaceae bacterium YJPT1-3]
MQNTKHTLHHLMAIFRTGAGRVKNYVLQATDCSSHALHDYYCDAERPFIPKN